MKKIILTFVLMLSFLPSFSFAQQQGPTTLNYSGFVQCDGVVLKNANGNPIEQDRGRVCNFAALINTAKSIINWAFMIAIPVIIGLLAYAGFLYMTGTEGNIKRAKHMMWSAVIGFVIMLCAWFLVTTALKWLLTAEFQDVAGTFIQTKK